MTDQPSALTVVTPFGEHAAGDRIAEADAVSAALASHPHHVVPLPDPPPAPVPAEVEARIEIPAASPAIPADAAFPAADPQPFA